MITRYTRPQMGAIWTDQGRLERWLEVELAATDTLAERGVVPREAAARIRERARVDAARVLEIEARVRHDVIAFTLAVGEAIGDAAHLGVEVEDAICRRLGLEPAPVASQVIQRDRHAEFLSTLAIIAATLEKIALEIRHLQRTEVREAEEPFAAGQRGSSAMPHKRNPVSCEQVSGLARVVRANAQAAFENIALWHERDISHSSVERIILPDSTILIDYMLARMTDILTGLRVFPERMRRNLDATQGLVFSGQLLLDLVEAGAPRDGAYQWVQENAMAAWEADSSFRERVARDARITKFLDPAALARAFDLDRQLHQVDAIFRRVFSTPAPE